MYADGESSTCCARCTDLVKVYSRLQPVGIFSAFFLHTPLIGASGTNTTEHQVVTLLLMTYTHVGVSLLRSVSAQNRLKVIQRNPSDTMYA